MRTILATAYDINPYKGSESGTGWNLICQIARGNRVIAITRNNNDKEIQRYILENDIDASDIEFKYFDLPKWAMFWKKGARFAKLYFYLWQMFLPLFVRRSQIQFDIAHNINFHTDTTPTFLWLLGKPTVWGPINHNEPIPRPYIGLNFLLRDRIIWFLKNCSWRIDPFLWLSRRKSIVIIGSNSSVKKRLGLPSSKFRIVPTVAASSPPTQEAVARDSKFRVVVVGRQVAIKSMDLAILSFDRFFQSLSEGDQACVELVLLGDGELHEDLKALSESLPSVSAVVFQKWIDHSQMNNFYRGATCLLNCSHEGAGAIIAEALSNGLPMISFNNFGAGEAVDESCSLRVEYGSLDDTIERFAAAVSSLYASSDLAAELSRGAEEYFYSKLHWNCKGDAFNSIYDSILETKSDGKDSVNV